MSKLLFLDTRDSNNPDTPSSTNWEINLPSMNNVRGFNIALQNIEIPNTVYPINSKNNKIYFAENGGETLTAALTENSYTGSTFATEIQTQLNAAGTLVYTVTWDNDAKKLTISVPLPDVFEFISGGQNAYEEMGFDDSLFTQGSSFTSDAPINISGSQYIDVITNFSTGNHSVGTTSNVLVRVPLNVSFGNIIYYEPSTDDPLFVTESNLDEVFITMRDSKGNGWDLPFNANVSLTLKIIPLY